jgi:ADP-ribosylarginine hydrolase
MANITIKEKISASLVLGSYLDTLGFNNGNWEFNFNVKITNIEFAMTITNDIINDFFARGGFNINISKWIASDDTIMMIATMKACMKGGQLKNFIDEYIKILPALEETRRVSGITTLKSLRLLEKYKDIRKIKYSSSMGGNGAAMRTHYIGIHFKNIDDIIRMSILASRLTHNYPSGFLAGMTTALFTHYAINNIEPWKWGDMLIELNENGTIDRIIKDMDSTELKYDDYINDKNEFWDPWYKFREKRINRFNIKDNEFIYSSFRYASLIEIIDNVDVSTGKNTYDFNRFGGSGTGAVIVALDSLLLSITSSDNNKTREIDLNKPDKLIYNWQSLVIFSTLHFGDNDTIGAITGMWFGALRGYDGVDKSVINILEFKKDLI